MEQEIKNGTYTIPEGFTAKIEDGKIIVEKKESEDERIRKLLVWQVHRNIEDETNDLAQSVYDGIKGHDPDLEESIEDWKKCLAWLEKQKEQKPAEWGEEDLQHKSWILECLADGEKKMPEYAEDFQAAYKWLKSLRPRPRWKPSEEQMEALENSTALTEEQGKALYCLMCDLKKL